MKQRIKFFKKLWNKETLEECKIKACFKNVTGFHWILENSKLVG